VKWTFPGELHPSFRSGRDGCCYLSRYFYGFCVGMITLWLHLHCDKSRTWFS